jgi:adenosylmethionine-8-amino-7-oxononanoate aminotransferase
MRDDAPNSWESRADTYSLYGFTDLPTIEARGSVVLTHGQGPYIFDVHGRKYLDGNSGLWNMVAGFDHPGLSQAAKDQFDRFPGYHAFFGRMADTTVALSEKLIEVSPFDRGRVFYTNSGSEANDTMCKLLWFIAWAEGQPQRRKIITRVNSYHGVTTVAASMTGKTYNHVFGLPLPGFIHVGCPHYWRYGQAGETEAQFTARMAKELEATIIKEGPDTIAGFFAEPVMGAGGVIPPSAGYFQAIQPVLKKYGIPLIADEVICGFGRTGNLWGCQTYDFMPDAIISSKVLTAGYFPMGAVILGPEWADRAQAASGKFDEFPHGFTASGHPVGCAIALKAIDVVMNEGLIDNVRALTPAFEAGLARLAEHKNIGEWRGKGLMGALEMVKDKDTKESFPGSMSVSERVANACTDQGLICRPLGQAIVLCPPFICTGAHMDEIFDKLGRAIDGVFKDIG